jgi:hypothetical protein
MIPARRRSDSLEGPAVDHEAAGVGAGDHAAAELGDLLGVAAEDLAVDGLELL